MSADIDPQPTVHFERYSTRRQTLPEAWVFVMEHVDKCGDAPSIEIHATFGWFGQEPPPSSEPMEAPLWFDVSVYGEIK